MVSKIIDDPQQLTAREQEKFDSNLRAVNGLMNRMPEALQIQARKYTAVQLLDGIGTVDVKAYREICAFEKKLLNEDNQDTAQALLYTNGRLECGNSEITKNQLSHGIARSVDLRDIEGTIDPKQGQELLLFVYQLAKEETNLFPRLDVVVEDTYLRISLDPLKERTSAECRWS
jgi:hypothetical protein